MLTFTRDGNLYFSFHVLVRFGYQGYDGLKINTWEQFPPTLFSECWSTIGIISSFNILLNSTVKSFKFENVLIMNWVSLINMGLFKWEFAVWLKELKPRGVGWGWGWEVRGRLKREGTYVYYGWSMLMYGRNQHNIVIILQLKINKKKKKRVRMPQLKIPHAPTKIKDPTCLN